MTDINVGQLSEALNDKMDRDAHNVQSPSAVIIEKQDPASTNNYTWYRKYSDGWIEQGGYIAGQADGINKTITYPVAFTSRVCDYNVHNTRGSGADQYAFQIGVTANPGLTSMVVRTVCNGTTNYVWSVKGI